MAHETLSEHAIMTQNNLGVFMLSQNTLILLYVTRDSTEYINRSCFSHGRTSSGVCTHIIINI
jgi:hypothetical protein